jgi:hypothetical protein
MFQDLGDGVEVVAGGGAEGEFVGEGVGLPIALILQDLNQQPDHWFWVLRSRSVAKTESITGENPIQPGDRGRLPLMAEAWLVWGRANGYQY